MTKFAERLKQLRKSSGITQQALADTLKISKSSVNMYERGEREPGLNLLEAIADVFNVDMNYITGNCDIPRKSLVTCNNPQVLPPDFTDDEVDLLNKYNRLDNYGKEVVSLVADAEVKRCEEQNTTPKIDISEYTRNIAAGTGNEGFDDNKINEVNDFARQIAELENNSE